MSTRASISMKNGENIKTIYCHFDGYPEGVGKTLTTYYQDAQKVKELISKGDLSVLAPNIEAKKEDNHSFENPAKDVCIFYGRDRNEAETSPRDYTSLKQVLKHDGQEYDYLYEDGKWYLFYAKKDKIEKTVMK